ncbi:hypothetical protein L1987_75370 [Smallanthus sonchifolius]|uniref:Uncharacterized protein n=2 Tax=Smallanthus sonchifolius TaxID=185202 RepID=A0ACB9A4R4_9ASTR|nr:hypothetical protein L1987_75367 [Smallanthus sonchifolius]KAI3705137.1 hypothetical protein L1987_75370 [Smallanthus sonchifolius]
MAYQNPNFSAHYQQVHAIRVSDLQALARVAVTLAPDLDGVEITSSNTTRINFIRRQKTCRSNGVQIIDVDVEYAPPRLPPWVATEPSAPPMPTAVGYPLYGVSRSRSHDDLNGCCTIM